MPTNDTYITAGQLANLHNITKQTVLFYDKNGLLPPAHVNENGYRYYSTSQYLTLALILNLRKMNVSLSDIRTYLSTRSKEAFEHLLRDKVAECDRIIEEAQTLRSSLADTLETLTYLDVLDLEDIALTEEDELKLLISEPLSADMPLHDRLRVLSSHTQLAETDGRIQPFDAGWLIRGEDFFNERFGHTTAYYFPLGAEDSDRANFTRPAGTYVTINFRGTYYTEAPAVFARLKAYLNEHRLTPTGDVYLLQLKNHLLTENTDDYLNSLSVQVIAEETEQTE
jgi:DNA-binding transcriptional MerR regulator